MTPTLMQTLAWSLLHFLWQGTAIAALAAALMFVFRKPATRYLLGVGALALMLLSFVVTFTLLSGTDAATGMSAGEPAHGAFTAPAHSVSQMPGIAVAARMASAPQLDFAWVARGWLGGVFLLALRIAFGLFVIEQLRRRNLVALPDPLVRRLQSLQARLGIARGIRYAQCSLVNVPAVIGFLRPVVLIPVRALTGLSAEQLDALIAHELGHIKRFDVAVNFVQVIAETLFFFHPAVWWLNKRIRADREDCCDDIAVAVTGSSVSYAKSLAAIVQWDARRHAVPSFAMAATGGPVAARIARLLGVHREGTSRPSGVLAAAILLAGALVTGAVSLGLVEPAQAQVKPAETAPVQSPSPNQPVHAQSAQTSAPVSAPNPPSPVSPPNPAAPVVPAPSVRPAPSAKPVQAPVRAAGRTSADDSKTSYLDEIRSAQLGDIDVDELVALKMQGVTAQYVTEIRATGLDPSVDQLIAMRVHGVTPAYVQQVRAMGFNVDVDEIIGFRVQGITPDYVQQVRSMGFAANADEIVAMKVHGVSVEYVKQLRELGLQFGADELIGLRVHGISPDLIRQMRAQGFDADTDQIIAMKVHDVTPEYRKRLESAGLKLSVDELVHAKVMDITPEFIDRVAAHGFKNLNIDQLIALRNADVL